MDPLLGGLSIGGGLVNAWAAYSASKARSEAMRRQADIDRKRAQEILERAKTNNELLARRTDLIMSEQMTQFAGSGREFGTTTLVALENTADLFAEEAKRNYHEAEWEATMINMGADELLRQRKDIEKAGKLSALGSLLGAGKDLYQSLPGGYKSSSKVPSYKTEYAPPLTILPAESYSFGRQRRA